MTNKPTVLIAIFYFLFLSLAIVSAQDLKNHSLRSSITGVQPMTGIVLWSTNESVSSSPIQLEYAYLKYSQVVGDDGQYNWTVVEQLLSEIAGRKHQAILRWHDTYVGQPTGVPTCIKQLRDYAETNAKSEGKPTGFPDWSNETWKAFVLDFFSKFAEKYDRDSRIAFVQVGFGLWAEYHIYDGPMIPGKTFPDIAFQTEFAKHLGKQFSQTPWMISVDAAGDYAPFQNAELRKLQFGLFDDSFNHKSHAQENAPNWKTLGLDRWKIAPTGGEFSFFSKKDQRDALASNGPYGIPFAHQAAKYHISFMIGDDQPRFRSAEVIHEAGMQLGYRFKVTRFATGRNHSELRIENIGIAPIYYDAHPAVDGVRSANSLKGLLPG
ncbi:MAG: DUF4832 domain-containing protein, partial [Pirellula sp.]